MSVSAPTLIDRIRALEAQLEQELEERRQQFHYVIQERKIRFERAIVERHRAIRMGLLPYLAAGGLKRIACAPLVYGLIVPLAALDLCVTVYQAVCFPLYGIAKVPRADFIAIDRHHLAYLNPIERLNCAFCGYANGLLAYTREIAARSEAHWCPIKHARRTKGQHRKYWDYPDYGDADGYQALRDGREKGSDGL